VRRTILKSLLGTALFALLHLCLADSLPAQTTHHTEQLVEAALLRAQDHYRAGKLNEAAGLLRGFIVSQPDSPLINHAYLYLAQIHHDLNEPERALDYLDRIAPDAWTPQASLLQARLLLGTADPLTATDKLLQLDMSTLTLAQRQQRWLLLSEAALTREQPLKGVFFLYQSLLTEGDETPEQILGRCRIVIGNHLSQQDLEEVAFMYQATPIAALANLHLGWQALAAGHKELALQQAEKVLQDPAGRSFHDEALELLAPLSDSTTFQRAIGVLLPLSGRYAAFGERVQRGMQMAQESFRPPIPVRFIYRDTAGDPGLSAQQLSDLAIRERVLGIAGPLVGVAAESAAIRATRERLPMLTLSQKEGLAESSLYVFRNSLTPQLQVRALVKAAIEEFGLTELAMLTPETKQGELFADFFEQEVRRQGGNLVAAETYTVDQTDFRRQVRLLRGLDPDAPDEEETEAQEFDDHGNPVLFEKEPPPFQALFLPDYADRISLLAPQLAFYGLENVQLLGTNGWNDPNLLRQAGAFVEGAIFTDGFFRHSPYPFIQEFVANYFELYGEEPTVLDAQGYDIGGILLHLFTAFNIRTREDLRRELSTVQNYPGVTGATGFDFTGEADKILFLLQVQDGAIVQIN
jgi:ABC-type branched-subunit amino acid transport system substrate-binding protein